MRSPTSLLGRDRQLPVFVPEETTLIRPVAALSGAPKTGGEFSESLEVQGPVSQKILSSSYLNDGKVNGYQRDE